MQVKVGTNLEFYFVFVFLDDACGLHKFALNRADKSEVLENYSKLVYVLGNKY